MSNSMDIIEELYGSRYKGEPLWNHLVKKLTLRQAYVFYYSLALYETESIARNLGILDLPDKTEVHRCLMDTLRKRRKTLTILLK